MGRRNGNPERVEYYRNNPNGMVLMGSSPKGYAVACASGQLANLMLRTSPVAVLFGQRQVGFVRVSKVYASASCRAEIMAKSSTPCSFQVEFSSTTIGAKKLAKSGMTMFCDHTKCATASELNPSLFELV